MAEKNKDNLLDKAINILQSFTDKQESWGVRELAKYLNYTVPTTHRILLQLKEKELLEFDEKQNKYLIGTEFIRMSSKVASTSNLQSITRPHLKKLADKYEETICLLMLKQDKTKIFFADKVNGPKPLQYVIPIGELQSLPYGSSGKTIMAYLEKEKVDEILIDENFSENEINKIRKQLEKIKEMGYFVSVSERLEGSSGIGSPILNAQNEPIGSIILTAPSSRVTDDLIKKAALDIKNTAQEISKIFGANI